MFNPKMDVAGLEEVEDGNVNGAVKEKLVEKVYDGVVEVDVEGVVLKLKLIAAKGD
jgi:hypothetical protein